MSRKQQNLGEKISFALKANTNPSKEQLLNAVFYFRQILAVFLGILAGFYHLQGLPVFVLFVITTMVLINIYAFKYVKIDESKFEENEVYTEALMISLMVFVLFWTLTHTFTLQEQQQILEEIPKN